MTSSSERASSLRAAEDVAAALFARVAELELVRAGVTEKQLSDEICALAEREFGVRKYWHKRVVRAGVNTLCPYSDNPPLRTLAPDDIVFVDFGPLLAPWEADFGRSYVLGSDPSKLRLVADLHPIWDAAASHARQNTEITGAELFRYLQALAGERGWELGSAHAGHLIGMFPEEPGRWDFEENYVAADNHKALRAADREGAPREWVLEVHLVDRNRGIGGFFEQWMQLTR